VGRSRAIEEASVRRCLHIIGFVPSAFAASPVRHCLDRRWDGGQRAVKVRADEPSLCRARSFAAAFDKGETDLSRNR
jgi:hypothetical protein